MIVLLPLNSRARQSQLRSAMTLTELLVVMAIIGVLIAILLPAVQAARASSRRASCANNLRQLSLSAHGHLNQHQKFPAGCDLFDVGAQNLFEI